MLTPEVYLDVVAAALDTLTAAGERDLTAPVTHCPGFDVGRLLEHTGGFCRIVEGRVARDEEWKPASGTWQEASDEVAGDPLGWHRTWGAALLDALRHAAVSEQVRTWAGARTRYFWLRRAAQELTVHRWDAEHALGAAAPVDPWVAIDGLDEFLGEFGKRAAPLYAGTGETFLFVADDAGPAFSVTTHAERFELHSPRPPDVEVHSSAETLYRFVWGRATPADVDASGDRALLDRWHAQVRL
jgi:uncharacterized protein (TIGR03083 family)